MATPRIKSVQKAFALLKAFEGVAGRLGSAELSRRAGLPEASGYRMIQTLEAVGAVHRDRRGRYRPSLWLAALSHEVPFADLLAEAAWSVLEELAERFDATARVDVLQGGVIVHVARAVSDRGAERDGRRLDAEDPRVAVVARLLRPGSDADAEPGGREETRPVTGRRSQVSSAVAPIIGADGAVLAALSLTDWSRSMDIRGADVRAELAQGAERIGERMRAWMSAGLLEPASWSEARPATGGDGRVLEAGDGGRTHGRKPPPRPAARSERSE